MNGPPVKEWTPVLQVEVGFDFGEGYRKLGDAAATGSYVFFEFDTDFLAGGVNPSPFRLKFEGGPQRGSEQLGGRSEEHTSELQSLMRISYAVFCLKKKKKYYSTPDQ